MAQSGGTQNSRLRPGGKTGKEVRTERRVTKQTLREGLRRVPQVLGEPDGIQDYLTEDEDPYDEE